MARARCEGCDTSIKYNTWPEKWVQFGKSEYGQQYDNEYVAWWCPKCFSSCYKYMANIPFFIEYSEIIILPKSEFRAIKIGNIGNRMSILYHNDKVVI